MGSRSPHQRPLIRPVSRELLSAHKDNLGTTIKFVVFNELSNARNPNNMQILYTVLQHSSELAPKVGCSTVRGASRKPGSPFGRGERRGALGGSCSPGHWDAVGGVGRAARKKARGGIEGPGSSTRWPDFGSGPEREQPRHGASSLDPGLSLFGRRQH